MRPTDSLCCNSNVMSRFLFSLDMDQAHEGQGLNLDVQLMDDDFISASTLGVLQLPLKSTLR